MGAHVEEGAPCCLLERMGEHASGRQHESSSRYQTPVPHTHHATASRVIKGEVRALGILSLGSPSLRVGHVLV